MAKSFSRYLDRLSDKTTNWLGSTASIFLHTVFFVGIFNLYYLGFTIEEILLILTTAVSLEAIYLAIFIQRAVNKQAQRLESAIDKIVKNVSENLEQPLDEVVGEIRQTVLETHKALAKTVAEESDEVIREVASTLHPSDKQIP